MNSDSKVLKSPRYADHLEEVIEASGGLILDAFGVFWAGGDLGFYSGSLEVFERLKAKNIPVIILSNSTQLSSKASQKYEQAGLRKDLYLEIITSGQIAHELFKNETLLESWGLKSGRKRYFVYQSSHPVYGRPHLEIFKGTGFEEVDQLSEADFIYVGIPHIEGIDQTDSKVFEEEVRRLFQSAKPMVVANPDRFVKEGKGPSVVRQGEIGRLYENFGGTVLYIGKPSPRVFEIAIEKLKIKGIDKDHVWMVGDNPETDIAGAQHAGIKSMLITQTGVAHELFEHQKQQDTSLSFKQFISSFSLKKQPTCFIQQFAPLDKNRSKENP